MSSNRKISVIGLGYVGLPVAVAFGLDGNRVTAYDIDTSRVEELRKGIERTNEVSAEVLAKAQLNLSNDPASLQEADFHIVTVPTPIDFSNRPDLGPLRNASKTAGRNLKKNDIVVYESTVFPGATEEVCVPILEANSGLACGKDFTVGYSPERINPGDKEHRLETITKVVSASDPKTLDIIAGVYASVVKAGVHRAPNIKTAEAAKVIENTQRDLNIALMNELSLIFNRMEIDTQDVLSAAGTKWNFLPFVPGLVGGHCIGVDPYYLTHRAEEIGYNPEVILAGRRINDYMSSYVAERVFDKLAHKDDPKSNNGVIVLGVTFKENVPDVRNSKIGSVVKDLLARGIQVQVCDPVADAAVVKDEMGIFLTSFNEIQPSDAVILSVPHAQFIKSGWPMISNLLHNGKGFVADLKSVLDRSRVPEGVDLWRL